MRDLNVRRGTEGGYASDLTSYAPKQAWHGEYHPDATLRASMIP